MCPEALRRAINYECYRQGTQQRRNGIIALKGQDESVLFCLPTMNYKRLQKSFMNILEGHADEIRSDQEL